MGCAALPPGVEPDPERPDVVLRAFPGHEAIAGQAAGLVDQGRGGRPASLVEHGVVQRRRAEVAGQRVSSSMASYNDARMPAP